MIRLDNISVSLPQGKRGFSTILKNITLTVDDGEWITLAGPNGSGKTTLLKVIAGVLRPTAGTVVVDGGRESEPSIGLLLQEPDNQFVASSVRYELLLSIPESADDEQCKKRLAEGIERFSLPGLLDRNPHDLSGGEKQRLAFATVWLSDPNIVLLDEPTSYLDRVESERCARFVEELNGGGATVVWCTPGDEACKDERRIVYLDEGRLRFDGGPAEFGKFMQSERDEPAALDEDLPAHASEEDARPSYGAVVSMDAVSFGYGDHSVFDGLSLDVGVGECVGVTGRNGSGKSTLLSLLSGILEPTSGTIQREYESVAGDGQQNVFHLFQNPERLFFAETVREEIAFGLRALGVPRDDVVSRISEALARVGLDPKDFSGRLPFSLSLGEMRRLAFAIALALDPSFIVLDEPASCLDAAGRRILSGVIRHFKKGGATVVVASHDTDSFGHLTDRIIEL